MYSLIGHVEGHIYAQPLYWRQPGAERGLIIAATESDLVYALDAATGHVTWRTELGRPVPRAGLRCGNIDSLGITGTPVLDAARGAVYLDAMIADRGTLRHVVPLPSRADQPRDLALRRLQFELSGCRTDPG